MPITSQFLVYAVFYIWSPSPGTEKGANSSKCYLCLSSMKWKSKEWNWMSSLNPKLLDYQKMTIFYVWYWYNTSSWPPPSLAMVPHSWLPLLLPVILCYSKCPLFWQKLGKMRHKIHKINIEYCNTLLHSTIVTHQTQLLHFFSLSHICSFMVKLYKIWNWKIVLTTIWKIWYFAKIDNL